MRLSELDPRWLTIKDRRVGLVFRCPHCRECYLSCFFECFPLLSGAWADRESDRDAVSQYDLISAELGESEGEQTVPCRRDFAWQISPEPGLAHFEILTITPSINAEDSGHWHGTITAGEIVGGL